MISAIQHRTALILNRLGLPSSRRRLRSAIPYQSIQTLAAPQVSTCTTLWMMRCRKVFDKRERRECVDHAATESATGREANERAGRRRRNESLRSGRLRRRWRDKVRSSADRLRPVKFISAAAAAAAAAQLPQSCTVR